MGSKKRIVLVCLVSFALGTGAGWWAGQDLFPRRGNREQKYQKMLESFNSRLKLAPEQRGQVKALLETERRKMEALRDETRPRRAEIRRSTQEDIRKLLSAEQQKKFDRMELEWQVRRLKRDY